MLCKDVVEGLTDFGIHRAADMVEHFDDSDFAAEASIDGCEFDTDNSCTDDDETFGRFDKGERSC